LSKKTNKKHPIRVLVTAGPTRAYLDPVRFLSNYSTGELGFQLCRSLEKKGIEVAAVVGPTTQPFHELKLKRLVDVETADEMSEATLRLCRTLKPDFVIFTAAVLDFKPQKRERSKVSSSQKKWLVEFVPTPKIIDLVGLHHPNIRRIGFKLEWEPGKAKKLSAFARDLLIKKKLDAVCINFLSLIGKKKHPLWIFTKAGLQAKLNTKTQIAQALANLVNQPNEYWL